MQLKVFIFAFLPKLKIVRAVQFSLRRLFEIEITFLCPLIGVLAGVFVIEFPANPVKLESKGDTGVSVSVVK